ncbi:MAG TPA: FAD-binding oxidoreductase [Gaiellaceae bacterium]|nr:FAD-binding oxidoreductase [Gaiellaceae bacterium]
MTAVFPETFTGEVIRPGDPGYDAGRVVWNGMIDRYPALIVRPTGPEDIAAAIRYAREEELPLAVRGGGHSVPGLSTCDDGLVIDLARMRGVEVDGERQTARANGGALLGELDVASLGVGLVCPVGVVSHTGVAGLTLGGGMGRLQRKLGLTIDSLLEVELVTADGRLVRANADENPELFWGLCGAGPNFGIATSFTFRLHPFEGMVTHGAVVHRIERAHELAALYRDILENGPRELYLSLAFGLEGGRPYAAISALHSGPPSAAVRDLAELRAFGPPLFDSIEPKTHLATQVIQDEPLAWGHRFSMKSAFLASLPDEAVTEAVDHVARNPPGARGEVSFIAWGGAIADVPEDDTAFAGREAAVWAASEIVWDDPALDAAARDWGRTLITGYERFAISGRYVNDVAETDADVVRSVYGPAKYERLVALKRAWDPDNVFRLNQNVRP